MLSLIEKNFSKFMNGNISIYCNSSFILKSEYFFNYFLLYFVIIKRKIFKYQYTQLAN